MSKKEFINICDISTYIDFLFVEKEDKYVVYLAGKWKEPDLVFYKEIQKFNKKLEADELIKKYQKIVVEHKKHIDHLTLSKMK